MTETFIIQTGFTHIVQKKKKNYNVCKNHDYCYVQMSNEDNKKMKHPFIIYANLENLL